MKMGSKTLVFLMTLLIFIVSISVVSAVDSNINSTSDVQVSEHTQQISDTPIVDNSNTIDENEVKELKTSSKNTNNKQSLKEGNTYTVTSDNINEVLSNSNDGDTLDLQGTFTSDITINKPLNIISSTGDVLIANSTFSINEGGSYSNITGLNFYNTQVLVTKADYLIFDHITDVLINSTIGSGRGHFAIRGSSYTTVNNSYFYTENSGGSSSVVFSICDHCTLNNCTVKGVGNVGNLVYLNVYNVEGIVGDDVFAPQIIAEYNIENNIMNNIILGPETAQSICIAVQMMGTSNIVSGNIINYTGQGINGGIKGTVANNIIYGASTSGVVGNNNTQYSEPLNDTSILPNQFLTKITIDDINSGTVDQPVTIQGKLTDDYDKRIPISYIRSSGNMINWYVEESGDEGTSEIQDDGTFSITFTPYTDGDYNINISVDSIYDDMYLGSSTLATVYVINTNDLPYDTIISLDNIEDAYATENITITGTLTDNDGRGLHENITLILPDENNPRIIETKLDGTFETTYMPTTIGTQTITVQFNNKTIDGQLYYTESTDSKVLLVIETPNPVNTYIELDFIPDTVLYHTATLSGTLQDENGNGLYDNVTITLPNNNKITIETDNDGNFETTYTPLTAETQTFTVNYYNKTIKNILYYTESNNTITFNVKTLSLILNEINDTALNVPTTISGSFKIGDEPLLDEINLSIIYEAPVYDTITTFYDEDKWVGSPTISGTKVTMRTANTPAYFIGYNMKELNDMVFTYGYNNLNYVDNFGLYNPDTDTWIDFMSYITSKSQNVSITHDDENLYVTTTSTNTIPLTGIDLSSYYIGMKSNRSSGRPVISDMTAYANFIANITENINVETDENGTFTTTYTPQVKTTYNVTAEYPDISGNFYVTSSQNRTFNIIDVNLSNITINDITSINVGDTVEISGTLKDITADTPIGDTQLYLNITNNDILIVENAVVTVNNEGTFTYTSDETFNTAGEYTVTITYDGDSSIIGTNSTKTFTVIAPKNTIIEINNIQNIITNEQVTITGTLTDENNNGIKANITINLPNEETTIETENNGSFTYTSKTTFDTAGEYNITVTYNGNNSLISTSSTKTFTVIAPKNTVIEIDDIDTIVINEEVTVTGTLTDEDGNGIKANITISLPDEETIIETEEDGTFTFISESVFDVAGDYTVTITYAGNSTLIGTDSSATFTVRGPKDTFIEIDEIQNITVNQPVTITGTLTDEEGIGIKANLTISLPSEEKIIETDDYGSFTFTSESVFASKGDYTVTITYDGDDEELLIGTTYSETFTVTKSNVTITLDPITANVNDEVSITARVTDINGNAVNGGKLIFKVNGVTVRDASGKVLTAIVKDGVASIDAVVGKTWTTGSTLEAVYAGTSDEYNSARFSDDTVFTISKAVVDVTVSLDKTSVVAGETIEITATITSNGKLVNNGRIIIKVNGITVKDANNKVLYVTVVNGVAKFNYTVPENWKLGDRNIVVIYDNSAYNRSEGNADFTIVKDNVTIDITPVVTTRNNTETQVTAQIKNSLNKPITGTTKVSIKVNGITFKIITVTDGIIDTTIDTSSLTRTDYTLTFVIGENSRYNSARQTGTLKIE